MKTDKSPKSGHDAGTGLQDCVFGFNVFSFNGPYLYPVLLVIGMMLLCMASTFYYGIAYMLVVLIVGFVLSRRPFLTIGRDGITLNYLYVGKEQVGWDQAGSFRYDRPVDWLPWSMFKVKGWAIVRKYVTRKGRKLDALNPISCVLFIPATCVAGSREEVEAALDRAFAYYVKRKRPRQAPVAPVGKWSGSMVGTGVLFLVWCFVNAYMLYLYYHWMPQEWEPVMKLTLVGGERFDGGGFWTYLVWVFVVLLTLLFVPHYVVVRRYFKKVSLALAAGICWALFVASTALSERHEVFLNCSEPFSSPVAKLHTTVRSHQGEVMTFSLSFGGKDYRVQIPSAEGVREGMPVGIQLLRQGARGLPIISRVEIPQARWTDNSLGDAYSKVSRIYANKKQYREAIETIEKAIKLFPDEAVYYDLKGEYLYRNGEKDRAREMRTKCLILDPDFDEKHKSRLRMLLGSISSDDIKKINMELERRIKELRTEGSSVDETESLSDEEKVFDVVEQMPEFPGGMKALMKWISENIHYPETAERDGIQGRVVCSFVVERDGSVSGIKVVRPLDPSLDAESVRVLSQMPRWTPGKQNGKAVRVKYTMPITFKLN